MASIFKYVTIADLRDEDIGVDVLSDARAIKLIARASQQINDLTDQWFVPQAKRLFLDGRGGPLLMAHVHALKVDALEILSGRTRDPGIARVGAMEPSYVIGLPSELPRFDDRQAISSPFRPSILAPDYTLDGRKIRALIPFPEGTNNVQIDGIFGWVHDIQDFETTLADQVDAASVGAARAVRHGSGSAFGTIVGGETLSIKVDGGSAQPIAFLAGDTTALKVSERINESLSGAAALVNGSEVDIASDSKGTSSSIEIVSGTSLAKIGHTVGVTQGTNGAATSCTLADASKVRPGHVLTFMSGTGPDNRTIYTAWVKSVSGNVVTFVDPAQDLDVNLPIDTRVADYGCVPDGIRQAALRMVYRQRLGIGTQEFTDAEFHARLKGEKTDNYQYQLEPSTADVTGDDVTDAILSQFVRPPYIDMT